MQYSPNSEMFHNNPYIQPGYPETFISCYRQTRMRPSTSTGQPSLQIDQLRCIQHNIQQDNRHVVYSHTGFLWPIVNHQLTVGAPLGQLLPLDTTITYVGVFNQHYEWRGVGSAVIPFMGRGLVHTNDMYIHLQCIECIHVAQRKEQ